MDRYCAKSDLSKKVDFSKVGIYIGGGAYGSVYTYDKDKAIKFMYCTAKKYKRMAKKLRHISGYKGFAKLYDYGHKGEAAYMIMERLEKTVCDHDFRKNKESFLYAKKAIRSNNCKGITKIPKNWASMIRSITKFQKKYNVSYYDFHYWNAMYDKDGNPKAVDLDSFFNGTR